MEADIIAVYYWMSVDRSVTLSQKSAPVAVFSPFSAKVSLFCDSVDRALRYVRLVALRNIYRSVVSNNVKTVRAACSG